VHLQDCFYKNNFVKSMYIPLQTKTNIHYPCKSPKPSNKKDQNSKIVRILSFM